MLRKALEAKCSQEEAKKHETGHRAVARSYRATSRVPVSVSGCIRPTPARSRSCEVKAAIIVDRATARYRLAGDVSFLIYNILHSPAEPDVAKTPCFSVVHIFLPSERFHDVMNIGAMVVEVGGKRIPATPLMKLQIGISLT
ncbi:hypothetical protein PIB30_055549 [Stylosanthes scabra]|uniref:Uncharacterized protein n=1 Tax=Stylosanthes scabra TaxID=79078 RepID=A0ABU6VJB6_9FABA|nr:hypothetical protein [Stylosanthes scabra]